MRILRKIKKKLFLANRFKKYNLVADFISQIAIDLRLVQLRVRGRKINTRCNPYNPIMYIMILLALFFELMKRITIVTWEFAKELITAIKGFIFEELTYNPFKWR